MSGQVRLITSAEGKGESPNCHFNTPSNVVPIFAGQQHVLRQCTDVLYSADMNKVHFCACGALIQKCIPVFDLEHNIQYPGNVSGEFHFVHTLILCDRLEYIPDVKLFTPSQGPSLPLGLAHWALPIGDTSQTWQSSRSRNKVRSFN